MYYSPKCHFQNHAGQNLGESLRGENKSYRLDEAGPVVRGIQIVFLLQSNTTDMIITK